MNLLHSHVNRIGMEGNNAVGVELTDRYGKTERLSCFPGTLVRHAVIKQDTIYLKLVETYKII